MKLFIRQNRIFLLLYLLYLITGGIIIATLEKGNEILYFNSLHTPFFDQFFKWTTLIAEWPIILFILVVAIRFSYGKGFILLLNNIVVFIIVQILKRLVFEDQMRPSVLFEGKAHLNFVQGVEIVRHNSFPSGHTAAAFALFFMASILINDKRWSALFFLIALIIGISRVYLLEHFFRDVYFGSIVGTGVTVLFYFLFVQSSFYQNLHWKDKSWLK